MSDWLGIYLAGWLGWFTCAAMGGLPKDSEGRFVFACLALAWPVLSVIVAFDGIAEAWDDFKARRPA